MDVDIPRFASATKKEGVEVKQNRGLCPVPFKHFRLYKVDDDR